MGKQPNQPPQFHWARQRPGLYTAFVDGIAYSITKLTRVRWELVGTVGPSRSRVMSTIGETAHELRGYARLNHATTLATIYASAPVRGAAVIGDAILCALRLPDASLTLTDEGNGWLASYAMRLPGAAWVRLAAFKPSPLDALMNLDMQVRAELAAGGSLHAEILERVG